jgi:hypothetical protein
LEHQYSSAIPGLAFLSEKFKVLSAIKDLPVVLYQSFCHFLCLIKESNQRKSRKNNASARKIATHTPLFFRAYAHGIFICLMILTPTVARIGSRLTRVEPSGSSDAFSNRELLNILSF